MNLEQTEWALDFDRAVAKPSTHRAACFGASIDSAFVFPEDGVTLIWQQRSVRIPYAYGVSDIIDDLLDMLEALHGTHANDEYWVSFRPSPEDADGLEVDCCLSWENDELTIVADWRGRELPHEMEGRSRIAVSKRAFAESWLSVLQFLCEATKEVALDDDEDRRRVDRLVAAGRDRLGV